PQRDAGREPPNPVELPTTVETIREHWRGEYSFSFRRGEELYSPRLGGPVGRGGACLAPGSGLSKKLVLAADAPQDREDIHRHFRDWVKTAWVDECNEQPEETTTGELVEHAMEEFRGLVRSGLLTVVALAHGYQSGESGEETKVRKRPLLHWAR